MFRNDNASELDPIQVLLIDGDPGYSQLLKAWFHEHSANFKLRTAKQLSGALRSLKSEPVDVVLVDLFLQDSSGLNTLTMVYDASPNAVVIVLTGMDNASVTTRALEQCAQRHLVKEKFDGPHLFDVIQDALERKRASQEQSRMEFSLAEIAQNSSAAIDCWRDLQNRSARNIHARSRMLKVVPRIC